MAVVKLYPPNIAGTLPSFYSPEIGTTTELVVPFSMNISVSASMISGFSLRLKTTATDVVLAELPSVSYDLSKNQITFILDWVITNKLVVGNFYKVQIAYYNTNKVLGYYSTTSVIKYTDVPKASIVSMTSQSVNTISSQKIIGQYFNKDTTERVYQYQFIVYGDENELENSGWLLHNSQLDTELTSSQDTYTIRHGLVSGNTYTIVYNVITNNNLQVDSAAYEAVMNEIDSSNPGYILDVDTKYDYEKGGIDYQNGGIIILVKPTGQQDATQLKGTYLLTRTSSDSDYKIWDIIGNFSLDTTISKAKPYQIKDYTIAAGVGYKYGLQKYNANNIFQKKVISDVVIPYFEDAFLYDGKRQLRIRFNPKVSSFKPVVQESKKVTLGRKYPYVLRNGVVDYKEFSISGLISYLMDNDEMFMPEAELLSLTSDEFAETTDIVDENIAVERKFKIAVLDWLNNGSIKLFKSPYEGNYLVRLTNISLSPNDTTSRMIHTFSCTATEVADYSISALEDYNLLTDVETQQPVEITKIINLYQFFDQNRFIGNSEAEVREYLKSFDFTEGLPCRKVAVTYGISNSEKNDPAVKRNAIQNLLGTAFIWGENNFIIGRSGEYEITLDEAIITPLTLTSFATEAERGTIYNQRGYLILTLQTDAQNDLNSITNSTLQYLCGYGTNGFDESLMYDTTTKHYYSKNVLQEFNTQKTKLTGISYIKYRLFPVVEFNDSALETQWENLIGGVNDTVENNAFYNDRIIIHWEKDGKYYKHINSSFVEIQDYCTNVIFGNYEFDITKPITGDDAPAGGVNTSIPYNANGLINLQVSSGVAIQVYGTAHTYDYAVEDSTEAIVKAKNAELQAYLDLCSAIYNFKQIAPQDTTRDMKLFTFINRKFTRIDYDEKNNYDQDSIFINNGLNNLISEDMIKVKKEVYLTAKQALNKELIAALKEG